jgi:hypothetical protein
MAKIIIDNSSYNIEKTNEATLIDQVEVVYDLLETVLDEDPTKSRKKISQRNWKHTSMI